MQLHGPAQIIEESGVRARLNPGTDKPFAVMDVGGVSLYIYTPEECDWLIKAAVNAKNLLLDQPLHCDHDDADLPWETAHAFIQCTGCDADACNACSRPEGDEIHQPAATAPEPGDDATAIVARAIEDGTPVIVTDDDTRPEPGGCMCRHPGYEHIYAGQQPCTQCACTAFAAMPVPAEAAGSAK